MSLVFIKDIPCIEELNVFDLSKKVPTPFYIYSQKNIIDNYNYLKSTLKKDIYFSKVNYLYFVKYWYNFYLLNILHF